MRLLVGSGISRMARTMLRLETRHDEKVTVRKVRTTPRLNEMTMVRSRDVGRERDAEGREDARGSGRERKGEDHAQYDADRGRAEVVGGPFREEHLDQVTTLGADGAGHAHLRLTLGGEHDEDHDDEEDAGADREQAEEQEEGGHEVADLLGLVDEIDLRVADLHAEVIGGDHFLYVRLHLGNQRKSVTHPAFHRDQDEGDILVTE